jgi:hypothetical protein
MRTTQDRKTEYSLTGVRATADPAERQRPLGKAYRLILSYEPQKKAAAIALKAKRCVLMSPLVGTWPLASNIPLNCHRNSQ